MNFEPNNIIDLGISSQSLSKFHFCKMYFSLADIFAFNIFSQQHKRIFSLYTLKKYKSNYVRVLSTFSLSPKASKTGKRKLKKKITSWEKQQHFCIRFDNFFFSLSLLFSYGLPPTCPPARVYKRHRFIKFAFRHIMYLSNRTWGVSLFFP